MQRFTLSLLQVANPNISVLFFALGALSGAVWYFSIGFEPPLLVLAAAAILGIGLIVLPRRIAMVPLSASLFVSGATLGAFSGGMASLRAEKTQISAEIGPVLVEGWIMRVEPARRGVRLVIDTHAIDGLVAAQTPDTVRLTQNAALKAEPGRFVRCWSVLRPPTAPVIEGDYAFDRQAWYEGLGAVGYVQGRCRGGAVGVPTGLLARLSIRIAKARRQLAQHVRAAAGDRAGGFAAALASGDRSFMPNRDQEALRGSGLAHLLAISGLHMGIVGGLIYLILWRGLALVEPLALRVPVRKLAAIGALAGCLSYLILSGASVSTQRAFIMAAVLFGAVVVDRTALSLRSLAIAMFMVIMLAPWSVLTPGFQMSFAATGALIATYESWQRRRRRIGQSSRAGPVFWAKSVFVTSFVSTLATAPFAFYHFERVAGLGLVANLAAMPVITLISAPCAALALVLAPIGLDAWALRAFGASLEVVLWIAHGLDEGPARLQTDWPAMPSNTLGLLSLAVIAACVVQSFRGKLIVVSGVGLISLMLWATTASDKIHWAPSGDVYLEYANGRIEQIEVVDGEGLRPLRFSRLETSGTCDEQLGCRLQIAGQEVFVVGARNDPTCQAEGDATLLLITSQNGRCQPSPHQTRIMWHDVVAENGITLEWRKGGFRKRVKPRCESRPWRKCRAAS